MTPLALDLKVELTDREAVIQHYKPAEGEENACCDAYIETMRQAIENTLMMDFGCPLTTSAGDTVTGIADPETLARASEFFKTKQLNAITITVSEPRPLKQEVAA
jgi:hypothetical protein